MPLPDDVRQTNKQVVLDFFTVYESHQYERLNQLIACDYMDHGPACARSPGDVTTTLRSVERAFPDLSVEVRDVFAEGDRVAVRVGFSGVHAADFMNVPASHRRIEWEALEIFRVKDARIVESWGYWPDGMMRSQMQ